MPAGWMSQVWFNDFGEDRLVQAEKPVSSYRPASPKQKEKPWRGWQMEKPYYDKNEKTISITYDFSPGPGRVKLIAKAAD
jgi:hypothetical protein